MQVVNRRRRNGIHQISTGIKGGSGKAKEVMGSRFTALAEETDMGTLQVELGLVMESHEPPMQYREMTSNSPIGVPKVAKTADIVESGAIAKSSTNHGNQGEEALNVASMGKVVQAPSTLTIGKHSSVRVEPIGGNREVRGPKGKILPTSIRGLSQATSSKVHLGVKGGNKTGLKLHKKDDTGKSNSTLASRLSSLVSDLNQAGDEEDIRRVQRRDDGALDDVQKLLAREWTVRVRHVSRGSNRAADRLVVRGQRLGTTQSLFSRPLADMVSVIGEEMLESGSVDREAEGVG
ncbi:hypothetical protein V6N11_069702 [Hibiscus sabdariffa]|uniref:RNase H type-1 domain-containing protein n=1 Tax=Hibiscus sabdariffa TaxID=183260 RepID=A0ABR2Q3J6_9ROSI